MSHKQQSRRIYALPHLQLLDSCSCRRHLCSCLPLRTAQHSTANVLVQQVVLLCRQSAIDALAELREYAPDRQWRLILVAGSLAALDQNKPHLLGESSSSSRHLYLSYICPCSVLQLQPKQQMTGRAAHLLPLGLRVRVGTEVHIEGDTVLILMALRFA